MNHTNHLKSKGCEIENSIVTDSVRYLLGALDTLPHLVPTTMQLVLSLLFKTMKVMLQVLTLLIQICPASY